MSDEVLLGTSGHLTVAALPSAFDYFDIIGGERLRSRYELLVSSLSIVPVARRGRTVNLVSCLAGRLFGA